jgi:hypothetical protein
MNNRRQFLRAFTLGSATALGLALRSPGEPQAAAVKQTESDPVATALGYKEDASKIDKTKFPRFEASQNCGNCALFVDKPGEDYAPCTAFGNKLVARKGWCAAWAKKP